MQLIAISNMANVLDVRVLIMSVMVFSLLLDASVRTRPARTLAAHLEHDLRETAQCGGDAHHPVRDRIPDHPEERASQSFLVSTINEYTYPELEQAYR